MNLIITNNLNTPITTKRNLTLIEKLIKEQNGQRRIYKKKSSRNNNKNFR